MPEAAGGGHAVAQGADEIVVHLGHRVLFRQARKLRLEQLLLQVGIVQLGVGVGDFHAVDEQLESLGDGRVVCLALGQRADAGRVVASRRSGRRVRLRPSASKTSLLMTSGCLPTVSRPSSLGELCDRRRIVAIDPDVLA